MSNPTDTNQAGELFDGLDKISGYNRLLPTAKGQPEDACNVCGLSPKSLKEAILDWHNKQVEEAERRVIVP